MMQSGWSWRWGGSVGFVEHGDAIGKAGAGGVGEVLLEEVIAHRSVAGEGIDGLCEVGVGSAIAGEDSGDSREDVMEVETVRCEEGGRWKSEVEDEEVSAGTEDAVHFTERVGPRAHISEAEGDGEGVE